MKKIRIAFIHASGLFSGGTERWLQMMAANLPRDEFEVDYFYASGSILVGKEGKAVPDYTPAFTDPARLRYMQEHRMNLIKFKLRARDISTPTHDWVDTNFWDVFDSEKYHLVQTAKAGPAEYPYYLIDLPVVECLTLNAGVDRSENIA